MTSPEEDRSHPVDAYDSAACGLLTTAADGAIQRVNATFCTWTGLSAADLVGKKRFQDLLTIGSKLFHQTHWMPLLQMQGSVAEVQLEMVRPDGRVLAVLVNAARRATPGTPSHARAVDIAVFVATDRRRYERELLLARRRAEELLASERRAQEARVHAEARLLLALDSARLRVWSVDLPSGGVHYEREVGGLIGAPELEEVTAEVYAACIHPDDRAPEAAAFAAAIDPDQRATYAVEYRLVGRDGVERVVRSTGRAFFDEGGGAVSFSGVIEDVTDRRRATEALRQRETEFRTLAENSPDVIVRFDRAHRFMYVSPAMERLTGRPVQAFLGKTLEEVDLASELAASWRQALEEAFAGRDATLAFTVKSPDGSQREVQAHVVAERNARGEIMTVLGITRDVTALKQQELEAKQRAVLAEQLVGIVSHDLRNPLNAVLLGSHLLGTSELNAVQARTVSRIASSAQRANRLINDLLDFTQARLGGGLSITPREVALHTLIADCVEEVKLAWPGRMLQHRSMGEGTGLVDADRVAQIVSNLANNALTYGAREEPVTITSIVSADMLQIRVHNGGRPIPEELQAQIFEPLRRGEQQVKHGSRSVGLGLYIVQEIAAAHGGRVVVRSTEIAGTTFIVTVPRGARS